MGLIFGQELSNRLPKDPPPYSLISFTDSNFAGDPGNRKLVMGYCFFFNRAVISWYSKKYRIVSTSTIEAKYITLGYTIREVV